MAELKWGFGTHTGQIRPQNEDSVYASRGVFVVADGMGGHEAGEVASQLAVDRIKGMLDDDDALTAERVVGAISAANGDIFRAAIANPGQAGMGTTVTAIAVIEDPMAGRGAPNIDDNDPIDTDAEGRARVTPVVPKIKPEAFVLANVGDSRAYLLRHNRLRRVTVDHSYVQELVATGHITDDEARSHPRRNIITRALGIEPDVQVDWWTLPLVRGDRYVLCSDGLVDEVTDLEITRTLIAERDPQVAADTLIALANQAGGRDNVTVVVVDVLDGDDPPDPTQEIDLTPTWADDTGPAPLPLLDGDRAAADLATDDSSKVPAKLSHRDQRRARKAAKKAKRAAKKSADSTPATSDAASPPRATAVPAAGVAATSAAAGSADAELDDEPVPEMHVSRIASDDSSSTTPDGPVTADADADASADATGDDSSDRATHRLDDDASDEPDLDGPAAAPAVDDADLETDVSPATSSSASTAGGRAADRIDADASDDTSPTDGATTPEKADDTVRRTRPRLARAIGAFVVAAVLIAGFVVAAAWARRGYYVDFDSDGDVAVFQGRRGGLLWIDPTIETTTGASRDELSDESVALVDEHRRFSSSADAFQFVSNLKLDDAGDGSPDAADTATTTPATPATAPSDSTPTDSGSDSDSEATPRTPSTSAPATSGP